MHQRAGILITRNFPPLQGGMERLNKHLAHELSMSWRLRLCAPEGAAAFAPPAAKVSKLPLNPLWRFLVSGMLRALSSAVADRPSFVLAGSGLTAPIAWLVARLCGAKAVVYVHGLDLIVEQRVYQACWVPLIRRCDLVIANSANTARLAIGCGVPKDRLMVLHPGVERPAARSATEFRTRYALNDDRILLSVGRLTGRKGLAEFVEHCLPRLVAATSRVRLVIIGGEPTHALHHRPSGERDRIAQAAERAGVSGNVLFLGRCDDATLTDAMYAADVHVFPVRDLPGDVEGFGMVAIEAAAHGLPTVAFAVGGVPEAVSDGVSGSLVAADDFPAMADAIQRWLQQGDRGAVGRACKEFAAEFEWPRFGQKAREAIQGLIDGR